jgi:hypothetical protein
VADHIRKQIRDAAVAAGVLGNLTTSTTKVYASRTHEMQDANLPGLRVYTNDEQIEAASAGPSRSRRHLLELVVEACSKKSSGLDAELDLMIKEVQIALDTNQGIGGAKYVEPKRIEIGMEGEGEKEVGVARMVFEVLYYTALGAPDVAL